jgi:hypothetical protein
MHGPLNVKQICYLSVEKYTFSSFVYLYSPTNILRQLSKKERKKLCHFQNFFFTFFKIAEILSKKEKNT